MILIDIKTKMCDPVFDFDCDPSAGGEPVSEQPMVEPLPPQDDGMDEMEGMSPLTGQLTYLFVSGIACAKAALELFRYNSTVDYTVGTSPYLWNPWQWATIIEQWTGLTVWGILFLFQLLSTFGVASGLNVMVWGIASLIGTLVGGTSLILRLLAYDGAYGE